MQIIGSPLAGNGLRDKGTTAVRCLHRMGPAWDLSQAAVRRSPIRKYNGGKMPPVLRSGSEILHRTISGISA
jgi:hypothetical protein